MHKLVEHNEEFKNIVDNVEWFVVPVANTDGYEFSRTEGAVWGLHIRSCDNRCCNNFREKFGDSEEETRTIQFFIDITHVFNNVAYVTIKAGRTNAHSLVTYPFSSNK